MGDTKRPRQVVIVDAENPMKEIRGEFFWREDHERLVAAARELAYCEGFEHGFAAASTRGRPVAMRLAIKRRRPVVRALVLLVATAFVVTLMGSLLR